MARVNFHCQLHFSEIHIGGLWNWEKVNNGHGTNQTLFMCQLEIILPSLCKFLINSHPHITRFWNGPKAMNSTTTPIRNLGHMVEVSVVCGSLTSLWPASFGLFACLDFGPCHFFFSLLLGCFLFIKFGRVSSVLVH
jgi:hypothetical protein